VATIYKPNGPGPFPPVVVLHHCGGIDRDLLAVAGRLSKLGYIAIVPDSFRSRGVNRVCATGEVRLIDRIPDA
jgi:dienelactone hydrolase